MSYQPFLIAKYKTGLDRQLEPWLIPEDSFDEMLDGYVYRGVISKREGYSQFATGKNTSQRVESRIIHAISDESTGQVNNGSALSTITPNNIPPVRGSVTVKDGTESHTDDGEGSFPTATAGSIDYQNGEITGFQFNSSSGSNVDIDYEFYSGEPVMGIMNFYNAQNDRKLIVADTKYVNRYDNNTDKLEDISPSSAYTGVYNDTGANFWSWVNYADKEDNPRLLFVNNSDQIQQYDGTTVSNYTAGLETTTITNEGLATGDGTTGPYSGSTNNTPVRPKQDNVNPAYAGFSIVDTVGGQTVTDNGDGTLTGDGSGTVNYETGAISVTFNSAVGSSDPIVITYQYYSTEIDTCLQIFEFKDRLIALRTTEGAQVYGRRIRISGFGQNADVFTQDAPGAGIIDLPDNSWIMGATFNRDDMLIFTEASTWILQYTGSDTVPFQPKKVDESRGSQAPFSIITYLNRSIAASNRGLIISDGYKVERMDDKIPFFTLNNIFSTEFFKCYSGFFDENRDVYLVYPTNANVDDNRMLVINFEEDTFAIYRIPLVCLGNYYITDTTITWADLTADNGFPDWDALAAQYSTWDSFPLTQYSPITLGGGPNGEIWSLNTSEAEDNAIAVRDISGSTVTTDFHNFKTGDSVFFAGVEGATEINGFQTTITRVDDYSFTLTDIPSISSYTGGGLVMRVIPFEVQTKQFNPYAEQGMKVRTGWMYLYTEVNEPHTIDANGNTVDSRMLINVIKNNNFQAMTPNPPISISIEAPTDRDELRAWHKVWINQVGDFLQFNITNTEALAQVKIHAIMPGFQQQGPLR